MQCFFPAQCVCVCEFVSLWVCVCVCVWESERERENRSSTEDSIRIGNCASTCPTHLILKTEMPIFRREQLDGVVYFDGFCAKKLNKGRKSKKFDSKFKSLHQNAGWVFYSQNNHVSSVKNTFLHIQSRETLYIWGIFGLMGVKPLFWCRTI